ncbi:hypothetical protein MC885_003175 [Smutsia gigantea]|nr:hypothetical protein MC885_003175 [Smutsia gigantea]
MWHPHEQPELHLQFVQLYWGDLSALEEKRPQVLTLLQPPLVLLTGSREASRENKPPPPVPGYSITAEDLDREKNASIQWLWRVFEDKTESAGGAATAACWRVRPRRRGPRGSSPTAAGSSNTSFGGFGGALTTSAPIAPSQPALAPSLGNAFPSGRSAALARPAAPPAIPTQPAFGSAARAGFLGLKPATFVYVTPARTQPAFGFAAGSRFHGLKPATFFFHVASMPQNTSVFAGTSTPTFAQNTSAPGVGASGSSLSSWAPSAPALGSAGAGTFGSSNPGPPIKRRRKA